MKKISPSTTALTIIILVSLVLAGLYVYLFITLSKMGEEQKNFAGEIRNADKIITQEKKNKETLEKYFVKEGEQASFVYNLEATCRQLSLKCDTKSLSEALVEGSERVKELSVTISADGSLSNVISLVKYFESAQYPIILSRSVITANVGQWQGMFDLTVPVLINQ
jgi:type IV secretory pathway VirJ component